jgi:hypothetical protein
VRGRGTGFSCCTVTGAGAGGLLPACVAGGSARGAATSPVKVFLVRLPRAMQRRFCRS